MKGRVPSQPRRVSAAWAKTPSPGLKTSAPVEASRAAGPIVVDDGAVFPTAAGWMVLATSLERPCRVLMGLPSEDAAIRAWSEIAPTEELAHAVAAKSSTAGRAVARLRDRLQRYFDGQREDFADVSLPPLWHTDFAVRVVHELRSLGFGHKISYGELAQRAGAPRAARAVGSVMANNPVPILVPCHRVLASCGRLGGFSAPTGARFKQWLLDLESA
jgi:methylated-DNA-[protein]-cysteine S-methyltransferase